MVVPANEQLKIKTICVVRERKPPRQNSEVPPGTYVMLKFWCCRGRYSHPAIREVQTKNMNWMNVFLSVGLQHFPKKREIHAIRSRYLTSGDARAYFFIHRFKSTVYQRKWSRCTIQHSVKKTNAFSRKKLLSKALIYFSVAVSQLIKRNFVRFSGQNSVSAYRKDRSLPQTTGPSM